MEPLTPLQLVWAGLVFTLGFTIRNLAGFGAVLIPALALFLPLALVVPVVTVIAVVSSVGIAVRHRGEIAWRELWPLLPFTVLGVLIGIYLFATLEPRALVIALGVFVTAFGIWSLLSGGHRHPPPRVPRWLLVAPIGTLAAAVGTTFGGLAGPVYGIYLQMLAFDKGRFRATMAAILVVLGTLRGIGYLSLGLFDRSALLLFAVAVPAALVGLAAGAHLHERISQHDFGRVVSALLILSGVALLAQ